jgi:DNA repair protein RecO (recombination protein O)
MNIVNTQIAYILHKHAYRETSSILEILTKDYGRVSLMARGCRGKRSKIAGNLMLFTPLVVSWQGKGNLPYLKSIERADLKAPVLKRKSLLSAMYINELLMCFLHKHDVHETIFEQYHHCLYALENNNNIEIALRKFEIKLLELLGFGLSLHVEADTGELIIADEMYLYYLEHGPVKCRDNMSMDGRYVARSQEGGAIMSMDGRYVARSQEGGAIMSMDGRPCSRYGSRSQEGGAIMSMDGRPSLRYGERSQESGAIYAVDVPLISGGCLLALSNEQFQIISQNSLYLAELKRLMRFVINHHLGSKVLKSRELFKPLGLQPG